MARTQSQSFIRSTSGAKKFSNRLLTSGPASEGDNAPVSYGINVNMYTASPGIAGNTVRIVSPSSTILMAPNYNGHPGVSASWTGVATAVPNLALEEAQG